jgi:hypothetical protein
MIPDSRAARGLQDPIRAHLERLPQVHVVEAGTVPKVSRKIQSRMERTSSEHQPV